MSDYFSIGKIVAAFGTEGEMILVHRLGRKSKLKDVSALFIEERKSSYLPYFIKEVRAKSATEFYIKLEGIDSREAVKPYLKKEVWLTQEDFSRQADTSTPLGLLGFMVVQDGASLGLIEEIIEQPHQTLCRIDYKGHEALIPLHEESLVKVDNAARTVEVRLPDGLLELYSEG